MTLVSYMIFVNLVSNLDFDVKEGEMTPYVLISLELNLSVPLINRTVCLGFVHLRGG